MDPNTQELHKVDDTTIEELKDRLVMLEGEAAEYAGDLLGTKRRLSLTKEEARALTLMNIKAKRKKRKRKEVNRRRKQGR